MTERENHFASKFPKISRFILHVNFQKLESIKEILERFFFAFSEYERRTPGFRERIVFALN